MSLSEREIALLTEEIRQIAGVSTVQDVREPGERRVVLQLRTTGHTRHLLVSTETDATRLHFLEERPDQPNAPSPFAMQLRKWIGGAAFTDIRQIDEDRIVELEFEKADPEAGDDEEPGVVAPKLICELAGRVGEIFLTDADHRLLGRQTGEAIGGRTFDTGDCWRPPPPPPDSTPSERLRWDLDEAPVDDRSRRVREAYERHERERARRELRESLADRLDDAVDRLGRRVDNVESDLEEVREAGDYRRRADLLQSAYGDVERGAESVTVTDYFDEQTPEVEIPLDPAKSLEANIEAYYHEANRLEDAEELVEARLLESIELRDEAIEALDRLESGEIGDDLESLRSFEAGLVDREILRPDRDQTDHGGGSESDERKPYREFRTTRDATILVGRGPESNDTLTTRIARGRDIWFHARDWAGAHVLLRIENRNDSPASEDLVDAATLAAHFSQGSSDTVVDVIYTRAKHVHKHGKHGPGRVSVSEESNIAVQMEESRLERLLESEKRP